MKLLIVPSSGEEVLLVSVAKQRGGGDQAWSISWNSLAPSLCPHLRTPAQVVRGLVQCKMRRKLCSLILGAVGHFPGFP